MSESRHGYGEQLSHPLKFFSTFCPFFFLSLLYFLYNAFAFLAEMSFAHISIGPLTLNFYGLMYALAAVVAVFFTHFVAQRRNVDISRTDIADIVFWTMIGGVLGGRLAYVLVYNFSYYMSHLSKIPAVWDGGMSIHGGLVGGGIALFLIIKKQKRSFSETVDLFMPALALGLAFGRVGNFVNMELPGRITDVPWGMDFGDGENRHVSSLYAAGKDILLSGILLVLVLFIRPQPGVVTACFFLLYGVFRFVVEFFREPDPQIGFLLFGFSMGQWLSVAVFLFGILYLVWLRKKL